MVNLICQQISISASEYIDGFLTEDSIVLGKYQGGRVGSTVDFRSRPGFKSSWRQNSVYDYNHKVLGSNPAGGRIQFMTTALLRAFHYHPFIVSI